jgi:hypothetical protein
MAGTLGNACGPPKNMPVPPSTILPDPATPAVDGRPKADHDDKITVEPHVPPRRAYVVMHVDTDADMDDFKIWS